VLFGAFGPLSTTDGAGSTVNWACVFPFSRVAANAGLLEIDSLTDCVFNLQADGLATGVQWTIRGNSDQTNQSLTFNRPTFTNMTNYGFYIPTALDANPALLDQIRINQPYIHVAGIPGVETNIVPGGLVISGSNLTITNMEIIGGRIIIDAPQGEAINFAPDTSAVNSPSNLQLSLSGDVQLSGVLAAMGLTPNAGGAAVVELSSATLEQTGGGSQAALLCNTTALGSTIGVSATGTVILQSSGTGRGYSLTPSHGAAVSAAGLFFRGFSSAIPTVAGSVGEYFIAQPPTSSATGWRCTTAGAANNAVWTVFH
jgi:hypothetical protein